MKLLANSNRLIFLLSLLGLTISTYLAYEYSLPTVINCPIGGTSCETVRQSAYSSILGIPMPHLGVAYYLTMAILSLLLVEGVKERLLRKLQLLAALAAVVFSGYLTLLEGFVIKAYCIWCVSSAMIATMIFILVVTTLRRDETRD